MKNNKLSYIIASHKSAAALENTICSIEKIIDKDDEIIVCSKNKSRESSNIKWVEDEKNNGSVYAFNKAYKTSQNDFVVVIPDDHIVTDEFSKIKSYFDTEDFQSLKLKACNITHTLGGPGKNCYNKKTKKYSGITWPINPIDGIKNSRPYNVWHFFAIERQSVEKYMDDVIFNTCFSHHWVDHWLGFYEEKINGCRPTEKLGPDVYLKCCRHFEDEISVFKYDNHDEGIFKNLVSLSSYSNISYNFQL